MAVLAIVAFAVFSSTALSQETAPEAPPVPVVPMPPPSTGPQVPTMEEKAQIAKLRKVIKNRRKEIRYKKRVMGVHLGKVRFVERRTTNIPRLQQLAWAHRERLQKVRKRFRHPPHKRQWLCIHRYEAAWNNPGITWDGRPSPYYGGLQMNIGFQRAYGRFLLRKKGTANRWTPLEQMWVAEAALRAGTGFYPWPNTARRCGLI